MQFTTLTALAALAASASAVVLPVVDSSYLGNIRAWDAATCGADENLGYVKLNSTDAGLCKSFAPGFKTYTVQSVEFEPASQAADGYTIRVFSDAACTKDGIAIGEACAYVGDASPASGWLSYMLFAPVSARS